MDIAMLIKAFVVGGIICAIGQLLIDYTKLTPARILVSFVVIGVILGGIGLYQPLIDFAGAGATVPLTGFGATLAKGVREAVAADSPWLLSPRCWPVCSASRRKNNFMRRASPLQPRGIYAGR